MPEAIELHGGEWAASGKKSQQIGRIHRLSVAVVAGYVLLLLMCYASNIAAIFARDASALDETQEYPAFAQYSKPPRLNVITMPPVRG